jgi:hypothetical protein
MLVSIVVLSSDADFSLPTLTTLLAARASIEGPSTFSFIWRFSADRMAGVGQQESGSLRTAFDFRVRTSVPVVRPLPL